jgi:hypothetical protein
MAIKNKIKPIMLISPVAPRANEIKPNEAAGEVGNTPPFVKLDEMLPINEIKNAAYNDTAIIGAIMNIMLDVIPSFLPVSSDITLTLNCLL